MKKICSRQIVLKCLLKNKKCFIPTQNVRCGKRANLSKKF